MRRSLFLLLLLFYAALAFGQGRHRLFRGLTQAKGLGNTDVKFVYQDQAGFMWLSSLDGLYRFDGNHARLFAPDTVQPHSLYGKMVQSPFFEDGRGDMWFTTEKAINCYRAKTGNFEHYFVRKPDGQMAGDQQHYAFHRDDADGALWVVVADSLYRFDTRHPESAGASAWVCALPRAPRCTFHATEQGMWVVVAFWEYGPGFELLRFDQGGHLQRRDTYLADEQGMKCYKSLVDAQHIIWLATAKGLVRFDVQQPEHWEAFAAPGQKPGVSSVCLYRADRLALATASSQLWLFDTQRKYYVEQQQPMTDDEGVVRPIRTKSVNCTRDGLLWCTEPGGGVYFGRLSAPVFQNLMGDRKSSNADIAQVYEDTQGRVWCSSYTDSTYLFETDGRPCGRFFYPPYTNFFRTAEGKTLCCSNQGIQAMKGQPPTAAASPITPVNNCVVAWKPGTALVGTSQGLFAVQQGKTAPQPIPAAREGVTALSKDRYGRWWVGGSNALQVWEIADDRSTRPIMQLHTRSMVNHIVADALQPDLMWVGTANGLWKIDSRDWSQHPISVGTGGENFVQSVVPD
ncbi:MAG TPA: hypothetical protein PK858_01830, partial [Saprospiraceae bacterium]|nr:hypothetical protein [Saprospiraceae bacterium]